MLEIVILIGVGLVLFVQSLKLLIRVYGPRTGKKVQVGTEYSIKGMPRKVGEFDFKGTVYLMKDHILDDFYDLIKYADDLLRRNDIAYSVSYGTLLGAIRHGGIMPWDDDADFFIYAPYPEYVRMITSLNEQIEKDGYVLRKNYDSTFYHLMKKDAKNNYPYLDFYYYLGTYRDDSNVFPLKRVPFEDFQVNAPHDPVTCINAHYGLNGKSDPLKEVVNDYPFSRYYSLWITQILKKFPVIHAPMERIARLFVKLF